jgi:hypothetical protein
MALFSLGAMDLGIKVWRRISGRVARLGDVSDAGIGSWHPHGLPAALMGHRNGFLVLAMVLPDAVRGMTEK